MAGQDKFYFETIGQGESYDIFDRRWNNTVPIASCDDVDIAQMIVASLNQFWERPQ